MTLRETYGVVRAEEYDALAAVESMDRKTADSAEANYPELSVGHKTDHPTVSKNTQDVEQ
jgi:hypothetical protein